MNEELITSLLDRLGLSFEKISRQSILDCELIYKMAKEEGQENEQWFLDWQDKLNEISVR